MRPTFTLHMSCTPRKTATASLALVASVIFAACGGAANSRPSATNESVTPVVAVSPSPPAPTTAPGLPSASPEGEAIHLVVIGDSIPFTDFCPGCTGFVERYAKTLEARHGVPVAVANRSRNDSAGLPQVETQVREDAALREELSAADVVIVSIGANNALIDAVTNDTMSKQYGMDWGCKGDIGPTLATFVDWTLTTTPACLRATHDAYASLYDVIFSAIVELRGSSPTVLIALNSYTGNMQGRDFLEAGISDATLAKFWRWLADAQARWNDMECDRATSHGFTCIDVFHAFNGPKGDRALGDLSIDGTHPSQKGNDLIADMLAKLDTSAIAP